MREALNMTDPFCELFPKMAACHYHRYGMGGREDDRHAICILGTVLDVLCRQQIKLFHVVSTSEFHEY